MKHLSAQCGAPPMAALALWLGVGLVACLLALVHVVGLLPTAKVLDDTHKAGMKHGYEMCMAWDEQKQEAKAVLLAGGI